MTRSSTIGLGLRTLGAFYLAQLRERLWLRPALNGALAVVAAFAAGLVDQLEAANRLPDVSAESIQALLAIISASMLVIAVFAVGAMLSAYASASTAATPRSFPLVVRDDISNNALSVFIGAFIFSIVALAALLNDYYGQGGRFALFVVTSVVFVLVVASFVYWVDRIARLGRMGNTIDRVEAATDSALATLARHPTMGAVRSSGAPRGDAVHSGTVGYVQTIDVARLQRLAVELDATITVCARPGAFVTPGRPVAHVEWSNAAAASDARAAIADAFVVARQRTFESDPRFGLIVLSQIASRALSPAVNDPGTAIDILGACVRLFVRWAAASEAARKVPSESGVGTDVEYDRVSMEPIAIADMFDDAFGAIARDGAAFVEVGLWLQKSLRALVLPGQPEMRAAALGQSKLALEFAERSLRLPRELAAVQSAALRSDPSQ